MKYFKYTGNNIAGTHLSTPLPILMGNILPVLPQITLKNKTNMASLTQFKLHFHPPSLLLVATVLRLLYVLSVCSSFSNRYT